MVERRKTKEQVSGTVENKLAALRVLNGKYYRELMDLLDGESRRDFQVTGSLKICIIGGSEDNPIDVFVSSSADQEHYEIYPYGLGFVSVDVLGRQGFEVDSQLGLKIGHSDEGRVRFDARNGGYPVDFCNQAEKIVKNLKRRRLQKSNPTE